MRPKEKYNFLPKNLKVTNMIGAVKEHVWNSKTVNLALGFQSDAEANEFLQMNLDEELLAGLKYHEEVIMQSIERARMELSEKLRRLRVHGPVRNNLPNSNPNPNPKRLRVEDPNPYPTNPNFTVQTPSEVFDQGPFSLDDLDF